METFDEGLQKAEKESETKRNLFKDWINKCKKEVKPIEPVPQVPLQPPAIKY